MAQVKWRGGMVGRPELQALFGARGSDFSKLLLSFAASDYSQHAVEYADQSRIALFVYDPIGTLTPRNRHAVLLLDGGHFSLVGRGAQPVLPLHMSNSKQGFWSQDARPFLENIAWPFLKVHWRIVGAIGFNIGVVSGISITVSPDPGQDRIDGALTLVACLIGASIFWWLSLTDYSRKKSEKHLNRDDISTPRLSRYVTQTDARDPLHCYAAFRAIPYSIDERQVRTSVQCPCGKRPRVYIEV